MRWKGHNGDGNVKVGSGAGRDVRWWPAFVRAAQPTGVQRSVGGGREGGGGGRAILAIFQLKII